MMDLTQQQEQEMIERAKAGDPEANYQMSLWALDQAIAEPEEERWNRLAAKCLVKAAEAGYEPAREKMSELLAQTGEADQAAGGGTGQSSAFAGFEEQLGTPASQESSYATGPDAQTPSSAGSSAGKVGNFLGKVKAGAGVAAGRIREFFAGLGKKNGGKTAQDSSADGSGKGPGFFQFSQWDDARWKKMQLVCVVICIVLVLLIIISVATKKKGKKEDVEEVVPTPLAEVVVTPEVVITPEPKAYPDEATRAEIAEANLEVFPEEGDYVDAAKTVTVSTNGGALNLRRGPGSSYGAVGAMDNGTKLDVYAYKNGWALVKADNTWGWCSNDYLK